MGAIEDLRKVMQDFLAPELRALKAEIAAVKEQGQANHASLKEQMQANHAELLRAIEASQKHMERRFESVVDYTRMLDRVEMLEKRSQ